MSGGGAADSSSSRHVLDESSFVDYHPDDPEGEDACSTMAIKIVGTLPESPTSTAAEEDPNHKSKSTSPPPYISSTVLMAGGVVILCLVATGLALGIVLTPEKEAASSSSSSLNVGGASSSSPRITTLVPTRAPTYAPTTAPTTAMPTSFPSETPSQAPSTVAPTASPTAAPTATPTNAPTISFFPVTPVPTNPPRGYFNYDPTSRYGPNNWHRVDTSDHWLQEFSPQGFGIWDNYHNEDLTTNICNGPDRKQSPKLLLGTEPCEAEHEIRTECAEFPLSDDEFLEKQILPHKLSIRFKRRPCLDLEDTACHDDRPPMADYPRYASGDLNIEAYSDMHHFDIKVPAEHSISGQEPFDAEIQMFHTSLASPRLSSIGVLVRALPNIVDNVEYQLVLEEFQQVYDLHRLECLAKRQRERRRLSSLRGGSDSNSTTTATPLTVDYEAQLANFTMEQRHRALQRRPHFNPYSDAFLTTMFFYRYDGSITEPPCRDITWWVMSQPMVISQRQLALTKQLLFGHINSNCEATSVHNAAQSVARPIFPLGDEREIQYCPEGSFRSDVSKGRPPAKRCRGFE